MDVGEFKGRVDFGIITIREDEFEAVLDRFPMAGVVEARRRYRIRRLPLADGDGYTIAVVRCAEQGTSDALNAARDLLEDLDPGFLLVVGIAGGVPAYEFTLGDVIVSTRVTDFSVEAVLKDHSREYALGGGLLHPDAAKLAADIRAMVRDGDVAGWNSRTSIGMDRPPVSVEESHFYGDDDWKKEVRNKLEHHFVGKATRPPLVITGAIASSDQLIKEAETIKVWLKIARQIQAVEMESAGVYKAAHGRVPFLAIRGISDVVGFKRHQEWTTYACHTAAAFTLDFLRARPIKPRGRDADAAVGGGGGYWKWASRVVWSIIGILLVGATVYVLQKYGKPDAPHWSDYRWWVDVCQVAVILFCLLFVFYQSPRDYKSDKRTKELTKSFYGYWVVLWFCWAFLYAAHARRSWILRDLDNNSCSVRYTVSTTSSTAASNTTGTGDAGPSAGSSGTTSSGIGTGDAGPSAGSSGTTSSKKSIDSTRAQFHFQGNGQCASNAPATVGSETLIFKCKSEICDLYRTPQHNSALHHALVAINALRLAQIVLFASMFFTMMWPTWKWARNRRVDAVYFVAFAGVLILIVVGLVVGLSGTEPSEENLGSDLWIGVVVGVLEALFMGLFVGRLESRFFDVIDYELVFLYAYVGIQPLFSTLRLTGGYEAIEVLIKFFALAFKIGLCLVVAKQIATNRLPSYMAKVGNTPPSE